jgi:hypothetical protein
LEQERERERERGFARAVKRVNAVREWKMTGGGGKFESVRKQKGRRNGDREKSRGRRGRRELGDKGRNDF